jgi:8-hydroxy-5-deazaflavin:NADPH oxidoreductase
MNIAILGSGKVGATLGTRWAKLGHHISFSSREPEKLKDVIQRAGPNSRATTVPDAVEASEVVVVSLPWNAAKGVLQSLDLKGKIILDCMNALQPDLLGVDFGGSSSAGEKVADWAPGAKVVKIFNTTGSDNMENPDYKGSPATMFYCGDDAQAKDVAKRLASELGFDPVDSGPLAHARLLEPMAVLWIWLAVKSGHGTNIAFRLERR